MRLTGMNPIESLALGVPVRARPDAVRYTVEVIDRD